MTVTSQYQLWTAMNNSLINVTPLVGNISWRSSTAELGQQLDFEVAFNDSSFFPKNPLDVGQLIILKNGKNEVLRSIIVEEGKQGRQPIFYTSFDPAFYLNKSKAVYQFNTSGDKAIKKILNDFTVPIGNIVSIPTLIKWVYPNDTVSDIIKDILFKAEKDQGIKYLMEMRAGKLYIEKQIDLIIKANFDLAANIRNFDGQYSISQPSRRRSIVDMKNSIQIVQDSKVIAIDKKQNLIDAYGLLQDVVEVQDKDLAQARNIAKNMLKEFGRIIEDNSIEMLGDYKVRAGRILEVNEPITGMKGNYLVTSATHTIKNGIHLMSLDLEVN